MASKVLMSVRNKEKSNLDLANEALKKELDFIWVVSILEFYSTYWMNPYLSVTA